MNVTLKAQPGRITDLKKTVSGERALSLSLISLQSDLDLSQQKALTFSVCQTVHLLKSTMFCLQL